MDDDRIIYGLTEIEKRFLYFVVDLDHAQCLIYTRCILAGNERYRIADKADLFI